MARRLLSRSRSRSSPKLFDIRLDDEQVVFRGTPTEAASVHLRGKVFLSLCDPLAIKHIKLGLTGVSRVAAGFTSTSKKNKTYTEKEFYEKKWAFQGSAPDILAAGNYEYPFDVVLEGSLPESVEGLPESHIIYRFKAEIGRKYSKDYTISKPLRIIRTFDSDALELAHAMSISNVWPNKLEYSISTPSKAVIYGTSVQTEFRLVSLLKGLKIGNISTQVVEMQEFIRDPASPATCLNTHKVSRVVAKDEYRVPEEPDVLDEEVEGFSFSRHIELPKSLTKCVQDVDVEGIKVRHRLRFKIQLRNPDDHMSELRATLPISFYISPSLAIDDNHELVDQTPVAARRAAEIDASNAAPPLYQDHMMDQLYSDTDSTGSCTPAGWSTPPTPSEADSSSNNVAFRGGEDVSASILRARLQHLRSRPSPLWNATNANDSDISLGSWGGRVAGLSQDEDRAAHFRQVPSSRLGSRSRSSSSATDGSDPSSSGSSHPITRPSSDEAHLLAASGTATPNPGYVEVEDLTRVPSYAMALRSKAPVSSSGPNLPSYGDATSGESSSIPAAPRRAQEIQRTELQGLIARSTTAGSDRDLIGPPLSQQIQSALAPTSGATATFGEMQDEQRTSRLLQARVAA